MARPTKLTDQKQSVICEALRKGHTHVTAAHLASITDRTFYNWMERGENPRRRKSDGEPYKDDRPFVQFFQAVKKAEAEGEKVLVDRIHAHSVEKWQAGAWILERRHPERWGKVNKHDITSDGEAITNVTVNIATVDTSTDDESSPDESSPEEE